MIGEPHHPTPIRPSATLLLSVDQIEACRALIISVFDSYEDLSDDDRKLARILNALCDMARDRVPT